MTTLLNALRDKSSDYHTKYAWIKQTAVTGFQIHATMIGYLTDHGPQHHENVVANLDRLMPCDHIKAMAAEEIFVLLCAAQFHDIGLLKEKQAGENWLDIRKEHVARSYDYLDGFFGDWGLNRHEAYAIKNICLGHGGDHLYDLPKTQQLQHATVRIQYLAALLRLADELDLDFTRAPIIIRQLKQIPPESLKHWLKSEDISGVNINAQSWTIEVHVMPSSPENEAIIKDFITNKVQRELDFVRPVLNENGVYYRTIDLSIREFSEHPRTTALQPRSASSVGAVREPTPVTLDAQVKDLHGKLDSIQSELGVVRSEVGTVRADTTAIRDELQNMRQEILAHYNAGEQRTVAAIAEKLDIYQLTSTEEILRAVNEAHVETLVAQQEILEVVNAANQLLSGFAGQGIVIPGAEQIADAVVDPGLNILHKLKLTIPIIPLLLQYEGELEFSTGVNLANAWEQFVSRIKALRKGS